MDFMNYVMEEALVLIPVLMILGKMIKTAEFLPNKYIPISLLLISMVLTNLMLGISLDSFIQSILVAGAAVFGHQLFKQMNNKQ